MFWKVFSSAELEIYRSFELILFMLTNEISALCMDVTACFLRG